MKTQSPCLSHATNTYINHHFHHPLYKDKKKRYLVHSQVHRTFEKKASKNVSRFFPHFVQSPLWRPVHFSTAAPRTLQPAAGVHKLFCPLEHHVGMHPT